MVEIGSASSSSVVQRKCATEDVSSPYHLVSGDNPATVLVNPQLNGNNFHSWNRSMKIALGAKNKLQLINKSFVPPTESDSDFTAWQRCDLMIQSWILNSCTKEVAQCILYAESASAMWCILEERFSQGYKSKGKQTQVQNSSSQGKTHPAANQVESTPKGDSDKAAPMVTQDQYQHLLTLIQNLASLHNTPLTPLANTAEASTSGQGLEPEDWHC